MSYPPPQGYGPPENQPPQGYPPPQPPAPAGLNITVVVVAAIVVAGGVVGAAILTSGRGPATAAPPPAQVQPVPVALRPIPAPVAPENQAGVNCVPGSDRFVCAVQHVQGTVPLMVCWQILVECANGVRVTGEACQVVQPGGTASRSIPGTSLRNMGRCDNAVATSIAQIVVTPAQ